MSGREMSSPVLKAALVYFALLFALGWVLGPIREFVLVPRFGRAAGLLIEALVMLVAMVFAARWCVRRFTVPGTFAARAAMGGLALALVLAAELAGTRLVRGLSLAEWAATFQGVGAISALLFLMLALMPLLAGRGETR
jgi:hypothetical protein